LTTLFIEEEPMKIAVLASGSGTNLQAIIDRVRDGYIPAEIAVVISDNPDAFALERAIKAGIETLVVNPKSFKSRVSYDKELVKELKERSVGLVVLAGFMRLMSPYFVKEFKNKILNIHPALLPSFKGMHGVRDALNCGAKITGPTVHFVDEELDHGAIILQAAVEVKGSDTEQTLLKKIHKQEHVIYPKAVKLFVEKKLKIKGKKVIVKE